MLKITFSARPNARGPRSLAIALIAGIALSLAALGPAATAADEAAPEDTIGISAKPQAAGDDSVGRTRFSYQMSPGQTLDDVYVVLGDRAQTPAGAPAWSVRVWWNPWARLIFLGPLLMALGGVLSLMDRRLRVGVGKRRAA